MHLLRAALAAVLLCCSIPAAAQVVVLPQIKNAAGQNVPSQGSVSIDSSGVEKGTNPNPTIMIGKQESFQLVAANIPAAAVTVAGGDYILSQVCSGYGTLNLQALGPDGITWQTLMTKSASDTAGGSGLSLGSYASVRVTVSGTAGCNAILARVPA